MLISRGRPLSRPSACAVFVLGSIIAFAAAAAPTPLYDRMQRDWGFPSAMLTAAFSVYALTLLLALLSAGSLSSYVGVRPVMVLGFSGIAASMLVLCIADSIGAVIAARGLQGAATGAVISAIGAGIVHFTPADRAPLGATVAALAPQLGSALGAVGAGTTLVLPIAPGPVVFGTFAFLLCGVAFVSVRLPDTSVRADGAWRSLLPGVSVPRAARREFFRAAPLITSGWMLGGLYLSLIPVIVRVTVGQETAFMGGLSTGLFCIIAAGAGASCGGMNPKITAVWGSFLMTAGALGLVASALTTQFSVFAVATILAASGFGAGNAGAVRLVVSRVQDGQRVELFSALYIVSYLAFGLPVAITGGLADVLGLTSATVIYGAAIGVLAVIGGAAHLPRRESSSGPAELPTKAGQGSAQQRN